MRPSFRWASLLAAVVLVPVVRLKANAPESRIDFTREVRPILELRCFSCHGPTKQRGDLRLDYKGAALKGGESGPVIVPGKSAESLLLRRTISADPAQRMPPTGERLTAAQLQTLRVWIDQGATWPQTVETDTRKTHWAFQPVRRPAVPTPNAGGWGRNSIDQFIQARLGKEGFVPDAEVDRVTLIRRLKFNLLGLPPTPAEVATFVGDREVNAYEKLVDRYLASPHFGERWARHWLDAVRFAETQGFETNASRPNAWPYRDYVIRALNDDRPYNQFIREQLAGDQLGADEATGYLVGGAYDEVKGDPALNAQQRADELHDIVSTTGSTFLGLTVGCARCHNHKFDPISQVDYHGIKAVFAGVRFPGAAGRPATSGRRTREVVELRRELESLDARLVRLGRPPVNARKNVEQFAPLEARFLRMTILESAGGAEPCLDELEAFTPGPASRNVAPTARATASGTLPGYDIHKLAHVNDGRYGNSWSWISHERGRGWVQLEFPHPVRLDRIIWSRDRNEGGFSDRVPTRYRIEASLKPNDWMLIASSDDRLPPGALLRDPGTVPGLGPAERAELQRLVERRRVVEDRLRRVSGPLVIYAAQFTVPEPTHRLHRGDPREKRELVPPSSLAEFGKMMQLPLTEPESRRRLALADWISEAAHPLTARVMVNRLWQHHFGAGIVATPSDFGLNGARPTHPELLDWLAVQLTENGWSMKYIHRLIVLSSTYRQASTATPKGMALDAQARLLWRYPPRRLEAEALRDSILFVSGKLDRSMSGPGFDLFESRGNTGQGVKLYVPKKVFGPAEWRRMIYQSKPRMRLDDTFGVFDCPDAGQTAPKRTVSTTPLQVLNLFNSPFMVQQAGFFAERLETEATDAAAQVQRGYWLAYQRSPEAEETAEAVKLIREHGLRAFCLALFNSNEFLFVF